MKSIPEELNQLIPEPDADFLARLDERMAQLIETRKGSTVTTAITQTPKIIPFPRLPRRQLLLWVGAVASVLLAFFIVTMQPGKPNQQPGVSKPINETPEPPDGDGCTIEPRTNWVVHVPVEDQTLNDIIVFYYGQGESANRLKGLIVEANCLANEYNLPDYLFIPVSAERQVVVPNRAIPQGTVIKADMLDYAIVLTDTEDNYTDPSELIGKVALTDIPALSPFQSSSMGALELTLDGQTFKAGEGNMLLQVDRSLVAYAKAYQIIMPLNNCSYLDIEAPVNTTYIVCIDAAEVAAGGYITTTVDPIYMNDDSAIIEVAKTWAGPTYQIFQSPNMRSLEEPGYREFLVLMYVQYTLRNEKPLDDFKVGDFVKIVIAPNCEKLENQALCPDPNPYVVVAYYFSQWSNEKSDAEFARLVILPRDFNTMFALYRNHFAHTISLTTPGAFLVTGEPTLDNPSLVDDVDDRLGTEQPTLDNAPLADDVDDHKVEVLLPSAEKVKLTERDDRLLISIEVSPELDIKSLKAGDLITIGYKNCPSESLETCDQRVVIGGVWEDFELPTEAGENAILTLSIESKLGQLVILWPVENQRMLEIRY